MLEITNRDVKELGVIYKFKEAIMLKLKSPVKKLSLAIALTLITGSASATTTVYETYRHLFEADGTTPKPATSSGTETLSPAAPFEASWAAGYFFVDALDCPAGCDLTGASLLLDTVLYPALTPSNLSDVKLEILSNETGPVPGNSLFELTSPTSVILNGTFGTRVDFTAAAQDPSARALLQADTAYWLKLTNVSQAPNIGWFYNGAMTNEYWAVEGLGNGEGSPFIFDITGEARVSHVPVPGAAWLMGSALFGLLAAKRKKIA